MMTRRLVVSLAAIAALMPGKVFANGYSLYGMGGDGLSRADAVVASVSDASAVWYNPSVLAGLDATQVEFSPNVLWYYDKNKSSVPGFEGQEFKNSRNAWFVPSLYTSSKFGTERWGFGFGVNAPYGLGYRYPNNSPFNSLIIAADLKLVHISPAVAYRMTDKLLLGGTLDIYSMKGSFESAIFTAEGSGTGYGFSLASTYKISDAHTVALVYKSQVVTKADGGNLRIPGFGYDQPTSTTLRIPDVVTAGYAFHPNDASTYEFDFSWQNWRDVKELGFENSLGITPTQYGWKNSYIVSTSMIHKFSDRWAFKAGYYFSKTPVTESTFDMVVNDMDHHLISIAPVMTHGNVTVHMPLAFAYGPDRTISNPDDPATPSDESGANGKVSLMAIRYGLTASYKFGGAAQ